LLHNRSTGFWVLLSIAGMVTGTVLGEAIGAILPDSSTALKTFFSGSLDLSLGPLKIDLVVFRFALEEIGLKVNLMSFVGLVITGFLYRWF
jgi:hypothetical protein